MPADRRMGGWAVSVLLAVLSAYPPIRLSAQDYRAQAVRLLKTVPLIDGHNDIPDAIRERGGLDSVDFAASQPKLMTDIPRLRAGGVGGQFWAAYVPVTTIHGGEHPAVYALEQIDLVRRLCRKYPRTFAEAATAAAVKRNFRAGKISCLIGIEGGHAIENSLGALRMVKANGGVVMVNFYPTFVSEAVRAYGDSVTARSRALRAAGADSALIADTVRSREASGPRATLRQVADHIEHIRDVAGVDHVGLGSDFDGITTVPVGLEDVAKFPDLLAELLRRGWSEQDVRKVAGLNVLRVLRDAERVSRETSAARD